MYHQKSDEGNAKIDAFIAVGVLSIMLLLTQKSHR